MVEIDIVYQGELRCDATHAPSGAMLSTDAPRDNQGRGESFSPTDLVAAALGTCMMTIMGIAARAMKIDLKGTKVTVRKEMTPPPRRIAALAVTIAVPVPLDEASRKKLIDAAMTCPVHESLHPDIRMPIDFHWA